MKSVPYTVVILDSNEKEIIRFSKDDQWQFNIIVDNIYRTSPKSKRTTIVARAVQITGYRPNMYWTKI